MQSIECIVKPKENVYVVVGCDAYVAFLGSIGGKVRGIGGKHYLRLLEPCRLLLVGDTGLPLLAA